MKILIVDDELDILQVIAEMYEDHFSDTQITKATNGALALHLCWQESFDLICTDYRMPAMDGLEFTKMLRSKVGPNQKTGIIFLSGFIPEIKNQAEIFEDVYFVDKPVQWDRLMRLSSLASKHNLRKQLNNKSV